MTEGEKSEFRRLIRLLKGFTRTAFNETVQYQRMKHIPLILHNEAVEAVREAEQMLKEEQ